MSLAHAWTRSAPTTSWVRRLLPALLATGAIGGSLGLAALVEHPTVLVAGAGLALATGLAMRLAPSFGALGLWLVAVIAAILAGGISSFALGGQRAHLLWMDVVLVAGLVVALLRGRFVLFVPRASVLGSLYPFVLWCGLSLLWARDPLTGMAELKEWLAMIVVGVAALLFVTDADRARRLLGVVAVVGGLIGTAMVQAAVSSPHGLIGSMMLKVVDLPWGRTNYLAGLLIWTLPVALGLLGHAKRATARLGWILASVAMAAGLVLATSKGAVLSLAVALGLAFAFDRRAAIVTRMVMVVILALGVAVSSVGPLQEVLTDRLRPESLDYSASERQDLYRLAWEEFARHPVTGLGINNFSVSAHRFHGLETVPHNFILGYLAELGVIGFVLACAWAWVLGRTFWRTRRGALSTADRTLALGMWAAFVGFVVHNQIESTLYGQQFKVLVVATAAAAWRLGSDWKREPDGVAPQERA